MERNALRVLALFRKEFRKDLSFFGACGLLVAVFELLQFHSAQPNRPTTFQWADTLFTDFVPVHACAFFFYCYLSLACLATILSVKRSSENKLNDVANHVQQRWTQLSSATIAFLCGFCVIPLLRSIFKWESSGLELAALSAVLSGGLLLTLWLGAVVRDRVKPFDKKAAAVALLLITAGVIWSLLRSAAK